MKKIMLQLNNVSVKYEKALVLTDISLTILEGEVASVIGRNGAGKTTLLRVISGLVRPSGGEIQFMNRRIETLKITEIVRLGIAHVPEGRGIFTTMSVLDNLRIGATVQRDRGRGAELLERVYELFTVLKERRKQMAGTLSGGEQQMLAIARALLSDPKLLLADEVSMGLAPIVVEQIYQNLSDITQREKISLLIVEQNAKMALKASNTTHLLEVGKIVMSGAPEEISKNTHIKRAYLGGE
jgi:branched-chain amino acid transport system ATP-binding protein